MGLRSTDVAIVGRGWLDVDYRRTLRRWDVSCRAYRTCRTCRLCRLQLSLPWWRVWQGAVVGRTAVLVMRLLHRQRVLWEQNVVQDEPRLILGVAVLGGW